MHAAEVMPGGFEIHLDPGYHWVHWVSPVRRQDSPALELQGAASHFLLTKELHSPVPAAGSLKAVLPNQLAC